MKTSTKLFLLLSATTLFACNQVKKNSSHSESEPAKEEFIVTDDASISSETDKHIETESGTTSQSADMQAGVLTAGEWNDIENFKFWNDLLQNQEFNSNIDTWKMNTSKPILIEVKNASNTPIPNIAVELKNGTQSLFQAKTDNAGKAVVWISPLSNDNFPKTESLSIDINAGEKIIQNLKIGTPIQATINNVPTTSDIEVAFMVDATGSMSDEMEFLKVELLDVIKNIKTSRPLSSIKTGTIFYRDEGDEYVTKYSPFTTDISKTLSFIKDQSADGGGDFPEAVHTALNESLEKLQWSNTSKTKLLFMLLDAPAHNNPDVIEDLHKSILLAAKKGVKLIPITASGIDKVTEFLMRQMAQLTNGTYIFITDHSGVGNSHLEPTIGQYQVEKLNKLLERIILKYSA